MTDIFPIVPAESRAVWWLVVIILAVMALVTGIMVKTALGASRSTFEVSSAGLRIRGDLYGRLIPASQLRGGAARVVDLRMERDLVPVSRRAGTATAGYRSGWFRLANGEKALLYLTDPSRSVYIPTTAGYSVLVTPQRPEEFVSRVRAVGTAQ